MAENQNRKTLKQIKAAIEIFPKVVKGKARAAREKEKILKNFAPFSRELEKIINKKSLKKTKI